MADEPQMMELGDCLSKIIDHRGKTPRKQGSDWVENGIPTLSAKNVNGGRIVAENAIRYVTEDVYKRWMSTGDVERGDCLLVSEGATLGECMYWDNDYPIVLGQRLFCLRANPDVLYSRYLYYYMTTPAFQAEINGRTTGTSVFGLRQPDVLKLNVKMLPLHQQLFIGDFLYFLDKKIELNLQMNATLESMAKALFNSWFVDFDPVIDNAVEAGNPIPEPLQTRADVRKTLGDQRKPLPEAIQNQFPSSFVFTEEMGWVPAGWEQRQLKDIASIVKGKSYKSSELQESKTALVTLKSFNRGGGYRLDGLKEYTGTYKPEQEVHPGDLVIAYTDVTQAADVIGKPAMVVSDVRYEHLVISLDVAVVRPAIDAHKYFLYGLAQTDRFQDHTHSHSTGTTVLHLGKNAVPDFFFARPGEDLTSAYVDIAKPIFNAIDQRVSEAKQLSILRDTLLPKLLSGQLRIPDAKKKLAEAI